MKIICTLNLKGGCAKTTTAVSMAELLATGFKSKHGTVKPGKVLLFDNDKQGNASRLFDAYQGETESPAAAEIRLIFKQKRSRSKSPHHQSAKQNCTGS